MSFTISIIPLYEDNYSFVIHSEQEACVIDPGDAGPIENFLRKCPLNLSTILVTHHHGDHAGGVERLKKHHGCSVIAGQDKRMPYTDVAIHRDGSHEVIGLTMQVITVPGHTNSHIAFYFPKLKVLFSGDSLFSIGCGRLFEGTPKEMVASLKKLATLDDQTMVYCGHEYTLDNIAFARSLEPHNVALKEKEAQVHRDLENLGRSIPSLIGEEKKLNPFLRGNDSALKKAVNLEGTTEEEVFSYIRAKKDIF